MGSGLILLVIVGAWLAVLVPMALRSHDSTTSLSSVDRFSDAMRVLSRREGSSGSGGSGGSGGSVSTRSIVVPPRPFAAPPAPAPMSLVERRRRTLLALLGAAGATLVGALVVGPLLWVHLLIDVLAVAFVVHCRRQQQLKAARLASLERPGARSVRQPARPGPAQARGAREPAEPSRRVAPRPSRVAGIPERMPARPAPLSAPLPAPAARHFETAPALPTQPAAAVGAPWSPVPVPVPTYVTKPMAPPRLPRVLDLTRPGEWTATLNEDVGLGLLDDADDLESILERTPHRRAVGD